MRVLGIDPGSRFTGYGVVDQLGSRLTHVGHGVIRLDPAAALEQRLAEIFKQLDAVLAEYRPQAVAVEGVFTFKNARSALVLGHARGVALLAASQHHLPVHEYSPARVKKSVGAGGASDKDAVARMVKTFLRLGDLERADASDALAIAICHLNHCRGAAVSGPIAAGASRSRSSSRAMTSLADRLSPSYARPVARRSPARIVYPGSGESES